MRDPFYSLQSYNLKTKGTTGEAKQQSLTKSET